jgi:predicted RNA-binding Zn ribbon-like protein
MNCQRGGAVLPIGPDATPHEDGGRLCLAVVNTVLWRRSDAPVDRIGSYPELVRLVGRAGWLGSADLTAELAAVAEAHPAAARRALARAIELREALFPLFSAVAAGQRPATAHLEMLNEALAEGLGRLTVLPLPGSRAFVAGWQDRTALDLPRWQIAVSAGLLLTSADRDRVKQCPGERCGWVFVDASRNRSRRWCDSRECGNRERVRAHYERTRFKGRPRTASSVSSRA